MSKPVFKCITVSQRDDRRKLSTGQESAPTAAPEVDVAAWTRRIHAARTRDDLAALTREMASAIPEAHPARDQLRREVQRRQDAIAYAESQARGLNPHWTGD